MEHWKDKVIEFYNKTGEYLEEDEMYGALAKGLQLLCQLTGADHTFYLKKTDAITSRLIDIYPDTEEYSPLVETSIFDQFESLPGPFVIPDYSKSTDRDKFFTDMGTHTLVAVSSGHKVLKGAFFMVWKKPFEFSDSFRKFLEASAFRMRELVRLRNANDEVENIKVRYNAILDTVPQAIVFIDNTGAYGWINENAAQILKLNESGNIPPFVIAQAMAELRNSANNRAEIEKTIVALLKTPKKEIRNWYWLFGKPVNKVYLISCTPTSYGDVTGRLWMFEDVTEQYLSQEKIKVLNEELLEKSKLANAENRAKSEFLANMSHEIRTPMNGVIGMTSLLNNTNLNEEQRGFVEVIRVSGESLLTIINDILDFSKIEAGKLELEHQPFALHTVIEETFDLLANSANEKGLDLVYSIESGAPEFIDADITRIRQILVNLVSNGIKFTEKGEILITVSQASLENGHHELHFAVKDSGIGISKDKINKLFQPFTQAEASTSRKFGGTGLGLAICSKLVSLMHGRIWVESEFGKGSVFNFIIKVKSVSGKYEMPAVSDTDHVSGKTILVVDDNQTNLKILKAQCELWNANTVAYTSGKEVIDAIKNNISYDLILLDFNMPGMDGIDTALHLKEISGPKLKPVILLSSSIGPGDHIKEKSLFKAIQQKPVKFRQLYKVLNETFSHEYKALQPDSGPKQPVDYSKLGKDLPLRILMAEDNSINQKLGLKVLEKLGYKADLAGNGKEVLEAFDRQHYDIVFMDVQMPVMDGFEATRLLKKRFKNKPDAPFIIALTANALAGEREKCLKMGMDDYLSKPVRVEEVINIIENWGRKVLNPPVKI